MFKLNYVLYVSQSVKNILSVPGLVSKGSTMGDTKAKMTNKKNFINIILKTIKGKNTSQWST